MKRFRRMLSTVLAATMCAGLLLTPGMGTEYARAEGEPEMDDMSAGDLPVEDLPVEEVVVDDETVEGMSAEDLAEDDEICLNNEEGDDSPAIGYYDEYMNYFDVPDSIIYCDNEIYYIMIDQSNEAYAQAEITSIKLCYIDNDIVDRVSYIDLDLALFVEFEEVRSEDDRCIGYRFQNTTWPEKYIDIPSVYIIVNMGEESFTLKVRNSNWYPRVGVYDGNRTFCDLYETGEYYNIYEITHYEGRKFNIVSSRNDVTEPVTITSVTANYFNEEYYSYDSPIDLDKVCEKSESTYYFDGEMLTITLKDWPKELAQKSGPFYDSYEIKVQYCYGSDDEVEYDTIFIRINKPFAGVKAYLEDAFDLDTMWNIDSVLANAPDSFVKATIDDEDYTCKLNDLETEDVPYGVDRLSSFMVPLNACQMNSEISLQLVINGRVTDKCEITFAEYLKALKDEYNEEHLNRLVDAVLNYGDYAKRYFINDEYDEYNRPYYGSSFNPMEREIDYIRTYIDSNCEDYNTFVANDNHIGDLSVIGLSLNCRNRIELNVYFMTNNGHTSQEYSIAGGRTDRIKRDISDNIFKVTFTEILIADIFKRVNTGFSIGDDVIDFYVIPAEYLGYALDLEYTEETHMLLDLAKAIFIYYEAGADYVKYTLGDYFDTEII